MGVDGSEYTPGEIWGHVNIEASTLTTGDHEFDVLGFENCCDGHAELEVHLPCDKPDDAWRTVVHGATSCLECNANGAKIDESCSMDTDSAACCGPSGGRTICHERLEDGTCDTNTEDPGSIAGRFVALAETMSFEEARAYCDEHYQGLASIHSPLEQRHARAACAHFTDPSGDPGTIQACWIGLTDNEVEGGFRWTDGSAVDYVHWSDGEPNNWGPSGEACSTLNFDASKSEDGQWNDAGCQIDSNPSWPSGPIGLCQITGPPAPAPGASLVWGTGQSASFRIQVCVDHSDTLFFQDDRLWMSCKPVRRVLNVVRAFAPR